MPDPTLAFAAITGMSILYSALSLIITQKYGNKQRVKEIQARINSVSKGYSDALKRNDKADLAKYEAEHARLPELLKESMFLQFKPLLITLPFLFILPWVVRTYFQDFVITLPFSLPVFIQHFEHFPNWRNVFGPVGWFWVSFIFASLSASLLTQTYKKLQGKK